MTRGRGVTAVLALLAAATTPALQAQPGVTEVIVKTGDGAPEGNGSFVGFGEPALNNAGQVAFRGELNGTSDDVGIFRGTAGPVPLTGIARKNHTAPSHVTGPGVLNFFADFLQPTISGDGQVAFYATVTGATGVYRGDGTTTVLIADEGQAPPDGDGTFTEFPATVGFSQAHLLVPASNGAGQIAFRAELIDTDSDIGVFRGFGGAGTLTGIARKNQGAPTRSNDPGILSFFGEFGTPAINDAGELAFFASSTGGHGVFRGSGTPEALALVAAVGDGNPAGDGTFELMTNPELNSLGDVAFRASLIDTSGIDNDDSGIFRSSGAELLTIVREGQAAPDGNGMFPEFMGLAGLVAADSFNDAGQVAFVVSLDDTSGGTNDDAGLFRGSGVGESLIQIAREGQIAPDGNGRFAIFGGQAVALNSAGQMAFLAVLDSTDGGNDDNLGLFYFDDQFGLGQVARKGQPLLGSTITDLSFAGSSNHLGDERSGLNELGQIAYRFALANGRQGIAIWTMPLAGDFNTNGAVENADLTLLLNNWATSVPPTPAGWIGTPLTAPAVDNDELLALLNNWGAATGTGSTEATVPEPTGIVLLSVALAALIATGQVCRFQPWRHPSVGQGFEPRQLCFGKDVEQRERRRRDWMSRAIVIEADERSGGGSRGWRQRICRPKAVCEMS